MDRDTGRARARTADRTPGELIAAALGAVYVLVGIIGFLVTSGVEFAGTKGNDLLGIFEVNPLHNIVHLAIGVALLAAFYAGAAATRAVATVIGAVYLIVGVAGFFMKGTDANILALNLADHLLHLGTGAALLVAAALTRDTTVRASTA
jgi:Domain of unknown function (DUF4383)